MALPYCRKDKAAHAAHRALFRCAAYRLLSSELAGRRLTPACAARARLSSTAGTIADGDDLREIARTAAGSGPVCPRDRDCAAPHGHAGGLPPPGRTTGS